MSEVDNQTIVVLLIKSIREQGLLDDWLKERNQDLENRIRALELENEQNKARGEEFARNWEETQRLLWPAAFEDLNGKPAPSETA